MTAIASGTLKRTPLHDVHVALGAKIVPFAGYEMPVNYPHGITVEHKAVREMMHGTPATVPSVNQ